MVAFQASLYTEFWLNILFMTDQICYADNSIQWIHLLFQQNVIFLFCQYMFNCILE